MKVIATSNIVKTFGIIAKNLKKKLGEFEVQRRIETVHTTAFLTSVKIAKSPEELSRLQKSLPVTIRVKKSDMFWWLKQVSAKIQESKMKRRFYENMDFDWFARTRDLRVTAETEKP